MSMPNGWIDRLFARLLVRYGTMWTGMWRGIDEDAVKADWAGELRGLTGEALAYGLENLPPDRPPTATQFRAICLASRRDERQPALTDNTRPRPNLERLRAELARLREAAATEHHPLEWVDRLLERQAGGEKMSAAQRDALKRMAHLLEQRQPTAFAGHFEAPPERVLPPGMRKTAKPAEYL